MKLTKQIVTIWLLCFCSFAFAEVEFSKIDEMLLLEPPAAGNYTEEVMIYSGVRSSTINKAMDTQFDRIENMMFINTVIESETGELSYDDSDECD